MPVLTWRDAWLSIVACVSMAACRPHPAEHPLEIANRGAQFDVRLSGCNTTDPVGRRFGSNIRPALLWSSEVVHTASYLPCTANIQAVRGTHAQTIYRISRSRDGAYVERLVHEAVARDSGWTRVPPR